MRARVYTHNIDMLECLCLVFLLEHEHLHTRVYIMPDVLIANQAFGMPNGWAALAPGDS